MGANPSKKNNTFSSSSLPKNDKVDQFLVSKPIKNEGKQKSAYNCNFDFFASLIQFQKLMRNKQ